MYLICGICQSGIDTELANIQTDLVQCPNCHSTQKLSELVETKELLQQHYELMQPEDSNILVFNTCSTMEMIVPSLKLKAGDFTAVGCVLIWMAFIICFNLSGGIDSGQIGMLTVGFLILLGILFKIRKVTAKQIIELDTNSLIIRKKGFLYKKKIKINLEDITAIRIKEVKNEVQHRNQTSVDISFLPTITHKKKDTLILEYTTEAEMKWGLDLLKAAMMRIT